MSKRSKTSTESSKQCDFKLGSGSTCFGTTTPVLYLCHVRGVMWQMRCEDKAKKAKGEYRVKHKKRMATRKRKQLNRTAT